MVWPAWLVSMSLKVSRSGPPGISYIVEDTDVDDVDRVAILSGELSASI